jgi:hypothetical protein
MPLWDIVVLTYSRSRPGTAVEIDMLAIVLLSRHELLSGISSHRHQRNSSEKLEGMLSALSHGDWHQLTPI